MPRKARRAGVVEGRLVARLEVNPGGTVEAVQLESAQPSSVYDDNVRAALARWTFDPPGRTVRTRIAITFRP